MTPADMLAADAQKSEPTEQKLPEFFASYEYAPDFSVLVSVYRRHSDDVPELVHQEPLIAQASEPTQQVAVPQGWKLVPVKLTQEMRSAWDSAPTSDDDNENMHSGYSAMLAAAPQPQHGACDSPELCKVNGACAGQYGTKQKCTAAPQPPKADALAADHVEGERRMVPMTPEQISDTYQKAIGQTLRLCDKHAVESMTREIEAHHEIGVKP